MKKVAPKENVQSCTLRLQSVLPDLKTAERRAADFILQNPQEALDSTINEIAAKSRTSYTTIIRLIDRIGFSGIKEMKKYLHQDMLHRSAMDSLDFISFSQADTTEAICKNLYTQMVDIMTNSYDMISPDVIEKAADKILQARTFCLIGTGLSNICARYAYSYFMRIGINCYFDEDSTHFRMKTALLKPGDVLFVISSSGRSEGVLDCARTASKNQVEIIALSDYAISPLSQLADIHLFTTPRDTRQFMGMDMPLLIAQIYIIDALYLCCCTKMGVQATELFTKTKEATESEKVQNF